jgi:glyoxylase-like metal-dependent hydrolase (beta-lactamase superfamily II)
MIFSKAGNVKRIILVAMLVGGCAQMPERQAAVERMYVINCGENRVKDLARWSAPDAGKSVVFSNHCYLIKHTKGWMLWDTGNSDAFAAMPDGMSILGGMIVQVMRKPLAASLQEIGVAPADIQHLAMSHLHGDHSGNSNLFTSATLYMQAPEYDAAFGPEPQKFGFQIANYGKLRGNRTVKLTGDHDVFGDGSVIIKSAPGHTIGHQVLFVRLPQTGPVVLSGDVAHYMANWNAKRVPALNFNAEQSARSMQMVEQLLAQTGATLWINHDPEQSKAIPKAPAFVQ